MIRIFIASILWLSILAACAAPNTEIPSQPQTQTQSIPVAEMLPIGDGGIISNQPCAAPCFFGIHIGETRLDQVVSRLEHNDISPCYQFNERIIVCGTSVIQIIVGVEPSTYVVDGITYYPSTSILIGEMIKKYGYPNITQVETEGTPEATSVSMFLLWDSIKMRVNLPEVGDIENYIIKNTTEVESISFMNEASYSNLIASSYPQPWKGYGTYHP